MIARRTLIAGAAALLATGAAKATPAEDWQAAADPVDPDLRARALAAVSRHSQDLWSRDVIAIADFGLPSSVPRLHLVDLLRGRTLSLLCAHGKGSDPEHSGMLQSFSDVEGSAATSEGAYLIGERYVGDHGVSRRLHGLDPTNAHALARDIVIHAAWYVGPDVIARQGKLGRSDGCFVVAPGDLETVLDRLGTGRLLYAGRRAVVA